MRGGFGVRDYPLRQQTNGKGRQPSKKVEDRSPSGPPGVITLVKGRKNLLTSNGNFETSGSFLLFLTPVCTNPAVYVLWMFPCPLHSEALEAGWSVCGPYRPRKEGAEVAMAPFVAFKDRTQRAE